MSFVSRYSTILVLVWPFLCVGCNSVTDCTLCGVRRVDVDYALPSADATTSLGKLGALFGLGQGAIKTVDNAQGNFILVELELNRNWMDQEGMLQGLNAVVSSSRMDLDIQYPTKPDSTATYNGQTMTLEQFQQQKDAVQITGRVYDLDSTIWTIDLAQKFEGEPEHETIDASKLQKMPYYCEGLSIAIWGIRRQDRTVEGYFIRMTEPVTKLLEPASEETFAGQEGPGIQFWNPQDVIKRQQGMQETESFAAIFFVPPGQSQAVLTVGTQKIVLTKSR